MTKAASVAPASGIGAGQQVEVSSAVDVITGDNRLRALTRYNVLDTDPEPAFDGLARLAAEICSTPVSLITFVDDQRQFFKAAVGFAGERVSPMDVGLCPQVVRDEAAVTITDTLADPRFADNSATLNGIRFYAGVPLVTADDHVLGTLCVLDTQPRPDALSERERQSLEALAGQIEVAPVLWTISGLGGQELGLHVLLVANGRAVVQRRVQADRIVPAFDEAEAGNPGFGLGCEPSTIQ